jgi:hypothetical protein
MDELADDEKREGKIGSLTCILGKLLEETPK